MVENLTALREILNDVQFDDWRFRIGEDAEAMWVQCAFAALDNDTGLPTEQCGRKWRISRHSTRDEVVQTCLLAVLKAVEHEARERFKYRGVAIFHTHIPVDRLVEAAKAKSLREDFVMPM